MVFCQRLNTGDVIRMTLAGAVEILEERRTPVANVSGASLTSDGVGDGADNVITDSDHIAAVKQYISPINVFELTSRKMFKYQQSLERRELKNSLGDRRAEPRLTASGVVQPDRRAANRAAYLELFRKAG